MSPGSVDVQVAADWQRRRPETTVLYAIVRDNLETLYGAIDDGALSVRVPKHARRELASYLGCGMLCCGFARLRCPFCAESRIVAFSCKGRGYAKRRNMRRREAAVHATGCNAEAVASRRRLSDFA